jgi:hypothetical protein
MNLEEHIVTQRPVFTLTKKVPMSTASTSGTTFKDSISPTPATATSETESSTSTSSYVKSTGSSPENEKSKKTRIPPNPRILPKLTSPGHKSSSFRLNAQPTPKSPRQFKETGSSSSISTIGAIAKKNQPLASSLNSAETQTDITMFSSVPTLKIVKAQISSELLKKLEREHIDHVIADFLVDDICKSHIPLDQRHAVGRTDTAFYVDHLPEVLQPYAKGMNQTTISSSRLMQRVFAGEFRENMGWASAKIFYANAMFKEKSQAVSEIGENDPSIKDAEREKIKGLAEVIAKSIFGHPVTLKNSPLPGRLIDVLIYADQRFHEKLLTEKATKDWTIEQISDVRHSLIKLLSVTRLVMPMVSGLAEKNPSQNEIWCLGLTMQILLKSASELSKEIIIQSFANSSSSLQKLSKDKEKFERIQQRTKALTVQTKKTARHIRSRSADTQPIDIDWLARRNEVQKKRAQEKKEAAIVMTNKVLSEVNLDDDVYAKAIAEGSRALTETEEVRKAESDIRDFSLEDLQQIKKMLDDRDEQEIIELLPEGELIPERAQPLPNSTADLIPEINSKTTDSPEKN